MDTSISIIVMVKGGQTLNNNINVCRILTGDIKLNDSHVDITRPLLLVITIILHRRRRWALEVQAAGETEMCPNLIPDENIREQDRNKMHIWTFGRCSKDEEKELLLTTGILMQVLSNSLKLSKTFIAEYDEDKKKTLLSFSTTAR